MSKKEAATGAQSHRMFVVDDEPGVCRVLSQLFTHEGWTVLTFNNPVDALNALAETDVDVILSDLKMPQMTGIEFLQALRQRGSSVPLLVITAHGTIDTAVQAIKSGAFDYLCKPFELETVKIAVERALKQQKLQEEVAYLRQELQGRYEFSNIIGCSRPMQEIYRMIEKAAGSKANVLVLGESGTGKELVARALHFSSPRSAKRFIAVSCAALPAELLESELFGHEKGSFTGANWQRAGRFELADGGTLFLDEIGDINLATQTKLLRVLQEREFERVGGSKPVKVDVRLVAATHRTLEELIRKGDFREDLYYRLRVLEITLPPLRDRREDIPLLVRHFLKKYAEQDKKKVEHISEEAMAILMRYDWPGNIRELENAIERSVVLAENDATLVTSDLLPSNVRERAPAPRGTIAPPIPIAAPTEAAVSEDKPPVVEEPYTWDVQKAVANLGRPPAEPADKAPAGAKRSKVASAA